MNFTGIKKAKQQLARVAESPMLLDTDHVIKIFDVIIITTSVSQTVLELLETHPTHPFL